MEKELFAQIVRRVQAGDTAELALQYGAERCRRLFVPQERLILLGGGHVALALAKAASLVGFSVVIADDRPEYANEARFPMAGMVLCKDSVAALTELSLRRTDYVCMLTRGGESDAACLRAIRDSGVTPRYLGLLGSGRRAEKLRQQLREEGFDEAFLQQLRMPVGISIGALTAEEIAISICAEMIRERRAETVTEPDCLVQTGVEPQTLAILADPQRPCALLLVVKTEGATPLKAGALMAVDASGKGWGTVGGGIVEAAALWLGAALVGSGERLLLQMNVNSEQAADGTPQGRMYVYLEDVG